MTDKQACFSHLRASYTSFSQPSASCSRCVLSQLLHRTHLFIPSLHSMYVVGSSSQIKTSHCSQPRPNHPTPSPPSIILSILRKPIPSQLTTAPIRPSPTLPEARSNPSSEHRRAAAHPAINSNALATAAESAETLSPSSAFLLRSGRASAWRLLRGARWEWGWCCVGGGFAADEHSCGGELVGWKRGGGKKGFSAGEMGGWVEVRANESERGGL